MSFRLHLADREPTMNPPDIQAGLDMWEKINSEPGRWAIFEAVQFKHTRMVHVRWGYIRLSDGFKEQAIQRFTYSLNGDGTVYVAKHTHN